jgi:hypothetical protein
MRIKIRVARKAETLTFKIGLLQEWYLGEKWGKVEGNHTSPAFPIRSFGTIGYRMVNNNS